MRMLKIHEKNEVEEIFILFYITYICVCLCVCIMYVRINEKLIAGTIACKIKNLDGLEICIRD